MIRRSIIAAALILISAAAMAACAGQIPDSALTPRVVESAKAEAPAPSNDDAVPVSRPVHLTFPAAMIDGPVDEYTAAQAEAEGGINPESLDTISWYSGIADSIPGTDATNTVYIFGHTWVEPAVFNGLVDVSVGDEATLQTETGTLTYAVDEIINMSKDDFTSNETVKAIVPGRLVLVTCHRPDGWDRDAAAPDNTAVVMHLVSSSSL